MKRATFYIGLPTWFNRVMKAEVQTAMARAFGGSTWQSATGSWMGPTGLVLERSAVVTVFTPLPASTLHETAEAIRVSLRQLEVYVWIESDGKSVLHVAKERTK